FHAVLPLERPRLLDDPGRRARAGLPPRPGRPPRRTGGARTAARGEPRDRAPTGGERRPPRLRADERRRLDGSGEELCAPPRGRPYPRAPCYAERARAAARPGAVPPHQSIDTGQS